MIPQLKKVDGRRPAEKPQERQARGLGDELARLEGPITTDRLAAMTARHIIRRLKLADDTRTWATLKGIIAEALEIPVT